MDFTSQMCTTHKQSMRLITLGLKKETADMVILEHPRKEGRYFYIAKEDANWDGFPAWSLHRLIEIMPNILQNLYQLDFGKQGVYYADFSNGSYNFIECFTNRDVTLYDNIIDCIEWLIKQGYFNKEYLK